VRPSGQRALATGTQAAREAGNIVDLDSQSDEAGFGGIVTPFIGIQLVDLVVRNLLRA
jgi:high-affinity K+ transport system ATPase subunit B